jgi:hypothetical protein
MGPIAANLKSPDFALVANPSRTMHRGERRLEAAFARGIGGGLRSARPDGKRSEAGA